MTKTVGNSFSNNKSNMNDQQLKEEYERSYGPTCIDARNVFAYAISFEDFKKLKLS